MKTDADIRRDVETELQWDPSLDERGIGVAVGDGVVTLSGRVTRYADRWMAEDIAKRVSGVRAIANDIEVAIPKVGERSDTEIAQAAASALSWHFELGSCDIKPVVKDGWVTLAGQVRWGFQRTAAENAIRYLTGVKGVTNNIGVKPMVKVADVKQKIEDAFRRQAVLEASDIEVNVLDGQVVLKGQVHSWQERDDAARAAWAAPGVSKVDNQLTVRPS